jgi:hypothetical protein
VIIDVHGHVSAPAQLYAYKARLLVARGAHGRGNLKFSDDQLKSVLNGTGGSEGLGAHCRSSTSTPATSSSSPRVRSR